MEALTDFKPTTLAEKAMLVKLTTRRVGLTRRDKEAEAIIQQTMDDESLVVNSKLFRDANNPVHQILSTLQGAYTYHRDHTLPYIDKGPRILPNKLYMEYTQAMRAQIAQLDALLARLMPNYDAYVQMDINYRSRGPTGVIRAKVEDYPTAEQFSSRVAIDLRFMPMPERKHFLFDINEEDEKGFNDAMAQAQAIARQDAVGRVTKPLRHLAEKLAVPIGAVDADGKKLGIFRDTTIENVVDGLRIARKLMVEDDPELEQIINALERMMSTYTEKKDWLRESPVVRSDAAKKLAEIADKMEGWMQ